MTFEQTMHTIESHLEALQDEYKHREANEGWLVDKLISLQAEYDRLLTRNKVLEKKAEYLESRLNTEMELGNRLAQYRDNAHAEKEALQDEYDRLLEENNQLKTKNAKLMQFKKEITTNYV